LAYTKHRFSIESIVWLARGHDRQILLVVVVTLWSHPKPMLLLSKSNGFDLKPMLLLSKSNGSDPKPMLLLSKSNGFDPKPMLLLGKSNGSDPYVSGMPSITQILGL